MQLQDSVIVRMEYKEIYVIPAKVNTSISVPVDALNAIAQTLLLDVIHKMEHVIVYIILLGIHVTSAQRIIMGHH